MSTVVNWRGVSGQQWPHSPISLSAAFNWRGAANYIFVHCDAHGLCSPIYIGQTADLNERMRDHGREGLIGRARSYGANEIHIHVLAKSARERLDIETDLRNAHATPVNEQPSQAASLAKALASMRAKHARGLGLSADASPPRNRSLGDILTALSTPPATPKGLLSLGDSGPNPFFTPGPPVDHGLGLAAYAPAATNADNLGALAQLFAQNKLLGR